MMIFIQTPTRIHPIFSGFMNEKSHTHTNHTTKYTHTHTLVAYFLPIPTFLCQEPINQSNEPAANEKKERKVTQIKMMCKKI